MSFPLVDHPPYVIGEIGFNHNGDVETAREIIRDLADAGADCAKLQLFRTDYLLSPHIENDVIEIFRKHEITRKDYLACQKTAEEKGIDLAASVFDLDSLEWYIDKTSAPFIKIASGDITFQRLLKKAGQSDRPIILSTGGAKIDEIKRAINWINSEENELALLHCISEYPTSSQKLQLKRIETLREKTGLPVGFSDHSESRNAPRLAAALGAIAWERHVTLDSSQEGPEHKFSLEISQLKKLIPRVKAASEEVPAEIINDPAPLLGNGTFELTDADLEFRKNARRSLMANRPIPAGTILEEKLVRELRPATGLPAERIEDCLKLPVPRPVEPLHIIPY